MKLLKEERGFTFLEMSFVLAIIGFFMLIGIPNYKAVAERAQAKSCEANRKLIEAQLESYYIDFHNYPSGDTTDAILGELVAKRYLKGEPVCPIENGTFTISKVDPVKVTCNVHDQATDTK